MRAAVVIVLVGGCGRIDFDPITVGADGTRCTPWSAPAPITELGGAWNDYAPALDRNGRTVYFTRDDLSGSAPRIYSATRLDPSSPFGAATLVAELDIGAFMADVSITADDLEMFVVAGDSSSICVWRTTRPSAASVWSIPAVQPATCPNAGGPAISADGLTLYLQARTGATYGTLQVATRASRSDAFDLGSPLAPFEGGDPKGFPEISTSGLVFYFENNHSGQSDIWQSVREALAAPFGPPTLLFSNAGDPALSLDGTELFMAVAEGSVNHIWRATRDCP